MGIVLTISDVIWVKQSIVNISGVQVGQNNIFRVKFQYFTLPSFVKKKISVSSEANVMETSLLQFGSACLNV